MWPCSALIGLVQVSGRLIDIPEFGALWPLVIIVLGLLILLNARSSAPPLNRGWPNLGHRVRYRV